MKKVLIVGANGQDGKLLKEQLLQTGAELCLVSRTSTFLEPAHTETEIIDISDFESVKKGIETFRPDEIYYLAAYHHSSEDKVPDDLELYKKSYEVNAFYVVHFLEALKQLKSKTKFFYACSSHVFGNPKEELQDENTAYRPVNVYGMTKLAGLLACQQYRRQYGVYASVGILYNHESNYRARKFISKKIVDTAWEIKQGKNGKLELGSLSAIVDWGYAPDYVNAAQKILALDTADDFVVATGEPHTVKEFVEYVFELLDLKMEDHVVENGTIMTRSSLPLIGSAKKLREKTNWKPSVDFKGMIEKMIEAKKNERLNDTLVFIPTYNERDNVTPLYERIVKTGLQTDILFLDDNSPDGTGEVIDGITKNDPTVRVIHRTGKLGIGSAHREGYMWATERGYKTLVTMDADFTHTPEIIPTLVKRAETSDMVIASRYLEQNGIKDWNPFRKFLTCTAHFLTTVLLGLKYDTTGAFRVYRLDKINKNFLNKVRSNGYSFFFESIYVLHNLNYKVDEIAVVLPTRAYGSSKMSYREMFRSLRLLGVLSMERFIQTVSFLPKKAVS